MGEIVEMRESLLLYIITLVVLSPCYAQEIVIKDNFFCIDGEKTFIKGIGYEVGATPGSLPWARTFDPDVMHADMQRILAGGFNTIRTWAPFTPQELDVLQQYDIRIIMGIWIDPHGDFSDPQFLDEARDIVTDVLSYSRDYDNIIAYLIMNEPLPETIAEAGYAETVALWTELIDIIHTEHPGRPVSIANTSNGTNIDPAIFDFSAYNVYIYNPVTVNYLHGYRDFTGYLQKLNVPDRPLIITEFGLSVSPSGPGAWGYGGNSLAEQREGVLHMYESLVDGGAAGACVFNYSDGWWKGGDEFVHNDNPEEWFGLVEYTGPSDQYGQTRPVWAAVKMYQSAIVTQPRSSEIYNPHVPLEIFLDDTIDRMAVFLDQDMIFERITDYRYLMDTLDIPAEQMRDAALLLHFYDEHGNVVKAEEKSILVTADDVNLPEIDISIANQDFWESGYVEVDYHLDLSSHLLPGPMVKYIYYPHVGFDYGQSFQRPLVGEETLDFSSEHILANNVDVFTVGAAIDVTFGNFKKRVVNELTMSRINDVVNSIEQDSAQRSYFSIYPNPSRGNITIQYDGKGNMPEFTYTLFDNRAIALKHGSSIGRLNSTDISMLSPGMYYLRIRVREDGTWLLHKMVKF